MDPGLDQNKLMEQIFGLKGASKEQAKQAANKKPTEKTSTDKDDPAAGLEERHADLGKVGITPDIEAAFAKEMNNMSGGDPLNFFSQMNDISSILAAMNAKAEMEEAQQKAAAAAAGNNTAIPQGTAPQKQMPPGNSSKNDEGMRRVQRELAMMRKQKSKKQDK